MPAARERILYLLGAGFSAPLGIPVMSEFLFKARDQYAAETAKYRHFADVFEKLGRMSVAKNFYSTDLFNIEEILSILEMEAQLKGERLPEPVIRFICDVIDYHTPHPQDPDRIRLKNTHPWTSALFGEGTLASYTHFVAQLFGLHIRKWPSEDPGAYEPMQGHVSPQEDVRYSVVTLNYDMVLEEQASAIQRWYEIPTEFRMADHEPDEGWERGPYLAKLHGSTERQHVVPPTWSKGIEGEAATAWQLAHRLMSEATQLRIIGYSLPVADSYVKYLMKSAALSSTRLKQIDILCLDPDNSVRNRYASFLTFPRVQFRDADSHGYLLKATYNGFRLLDSKQEFAQSLGLEWAHRDFMAGL